MHSARFAQDVTDFPIDVTFNGDPDSPFVTYQDISPSDLDDQCRAWLHARVNDTYDSPVGGELPVTLRGGQQVVVKLSLDPAESRHVVIDFSV